MLEENRVLLRLKAAVQAVLEEDWVGKAGRRFRQSLRRLSELNDNHLHLKERAMEAPSLAWHAVEGAASEKHAKAMLDYAKEENERIEGELKRRALESKVRQERAAADKLEAEARIAQITELRARMELVAELQRLGVRLKFDEDQRQMTVQKAPMDYDWSLPIQKGILSAAEQDLLSPSEIDVVVPQTTGSTAEVKIVAWKKMVGDAVTVGELLLVVNGNGVEKDIACPATGTLNRILVEAGSAIPPGFNVAGKVKIS